MNISFIVPCMGRLVHLKKTLPLFAAQAKVVLVDYSCPEKSGEYVKSLNNDNISVVSILNQKYFNISKARNAGAAAADTEWLCFIDADDIINKEFISEVEAIAHSGRYLSFELEQLGYSGVICCRKHDWKRAEGFDEAVCGYGYDDTIFKKKLTALRLSRYNLPMSIMSHITHGFDERVANYESKDTTESWARNKYILDRNYLDFLTRKGLW